MENEALEVGYYIFLEHYIGLFYYYNFAKYMQLQIWRPRIALTVLPGKP